MKQKTVALRGCSDFVSREMKQLSDLCRNLLILAVLPWLFCLCTVILPIIPLRGFEATTVYVGLAFWCGALLALIALALSVVSLVRFGRNPGRVKICFWSIGTLLAFGALPVALTIIGSQ
jgi:hypothetical protein